MYGWGGELYLDIPFKVVNDFKQKKLINGLASNGHSNGEWNIILGFVSFNEIEKTELIGYPKT